MLRLRKTSLDLCFPENHMFSCHWIIFAKLKFFCLRSWIFFRHIVVACIGAAEQLNNNGIRLCHSASPEEELMILRNFAEIDGFPTNCQAFEYLKWYTFPLCCLRLSRFVKLNYFFLSFALTTPPLFARHTSFAPIRRACD